MEADHVNTPDSNEKKREKKPNAKRKRHAMDGSLSPCRNVNNLQQELAAIEYIAEDEIATRLIAPVGMKVGRIIDIVKKQTETNNVLSGDNTNPNAKLKDIMATIRKLRKSRHNSGYQDAHHVMFEWRHRKRLACSDDDHLILLPVKSTHACIAWNLYW